MASSDCLIAYIVSFLPKDLRQFGLDQLTCVLKGHTLVIVISLLSRSYLLSMHFSYLERMICFR